MFGTDEFTAPPPYLSVQRLRGYWQATADEKSAIPQPSDLDPRGLSPILSDLFMGERIGRGMIQLQVAGQNLSELSGHDLQGLPLSLLFTPEARLRLVEVIDRIFSQNLIVEMELEAERTLLRPSVTARLLLLPLRSVRSGRESLIGCFAVKGAIGRAPRRFAIASIEEEAVLLPEPPRVSAPEALSEAARGKVPLFRRLPQPQPLLPASRNEVPAFRLPPNGPEGNRSPRFSVFYPDEALREKLVREREDQPDAPASRPQLRLVYSAEA